MKNVRTLLKKATQDGAAKSSILTINKGTGAQNWCRKKNGIVEFYVEVTGVSWSSGWNTIATLPSGYRPMSYYDFNGLDSNNDTSCHAKVTGAGEIQIYKAGSLSGSVRIHGVHYASGGVINHLRSAITNLFREEVMA